MKNNFKQPPIWKRFIIIVLIIALPLFFLFYRGIKTQQAIQKTEPLHNDTRAALQKS